VWHTQGSGKSLTMVFAALKLKFHRGISSPRLQNPNLLIITDRIDLHNQIAATFEACGLPNPVPANAELDCVGLIERRFRQEGWTTRDLYAAFLQASLLSYQSSRDAEDKYGYRYINSTPSDYEHNCPWNDWTPPSKSIELFQAAAEASAIKSDIVLRRVRVHLCREAAPESDTVIAFASIETNQEGTACLRLRRGAEILASLPVERLTVAIVCRGLLMLSTTGATEAWPSLWLKPWPSMWLKFETHAKLTKFCDMLELESQ
jgi:hypothetical protein